VKKPAIKRGLLFLRWASCRALGEKLTCPLG